MDLDKLLIDRLIQDKRIELVIDAGITAEDVEGPMKPVFEYILEYYQNPRYKGELPTARTLHRLFKEYKFEAVEESVEWISDQLKERSKYNLMKREFSAIGSALKEGDVATAEQLFATAAIKVSSKRSHAQLSSLTHNQDERFRRYAMRRDKIALYGIPSGFSWLDNVTLGWQDGDFVLLLAKRGIGKTWASLIMAHAAQMAGHSVMYVPMEMGRKSIEMRYDALHAKLPYKSFRRGEIGKFAEDNYKKVLKDMSGLAPFYIPEFEDMVTPLTIEAKARELDAKLIVIDGGYMVQADDGARGWEKVLSVAGGIKKFIKATGKVLVITNQLNKEEDPRYATLDNSAFGDAWGMFADVAVKFHQGSDERVNHQMLMNLLKVREDETPHEPARLPWDFEEMVFDTTEEMEEVEENVDYS